MLKLILMIAMSMIFSVNAEPRSKLFLLKPQFDFKKINGERFYTFDEYNAKILKAKHSMITNLFLPSTNCIYSNLIFNNEVLAGNLFLLETKLKNKTLKQKIKDYGIVSLAIIVVIETIIIAIK